MWTKLWNWVKSPGAMAIASIFSIGFGVYTGFFYERRPRLEVVAQDAASRVFDLHRPVNLLEVRYAGEDLQKTKRALWLVRAKLVNTGNAELKRADYDEQFPPTLKLSVGSVVEATLEGSNQYLSDSAKTAVGQQSISVLPAILEPEDWIRVTVLAVGPDGVPPTLSVSGKISGQKLIPVSFEGRSPDVGLLRSTFFVPGGKFYIHVIRSFAYSVLGFLIFAAAFGLVGVASGLTEGRRRKVRREQIRAIGDLWPRELEDWGKFFSEEYVQRGTNGLSMLSYTLKRLEKWKAEGRDPEDFRLLQSTLGLSYINTRTGARYGPPKAENYSEANELLGTLMQRLSDSRKQMAIVRTAPPEPPPAA